MKWGIVAALRHEGESSACSSPQPLASPLSSDLQWSRVASAPAPTAAPELAFSEANSLSVRKVFGGHAAGGWETETCCCSASLLSASAFWSAASRRAIDPDLFARSSRLSPSALRRPHSPTVAWRELLSLQPVASLRSPTDLLHGNGDCRLFYSCHGRGILHLVVKVQHEQVRTLIQLHQTVRDWHTS